VPQGVGRSGGGVDILLEMGVGGVGCEIVRGWTGKGIKCGL